MKNQILLSFVLSCCFTALLMFGCGPSKEEMERTEREQGHVRTTDNGNYEIITIEGCEYLKRTSAQGEVLTHKGNCKNRSQH